MSRTVLKMKIRVLGIRVKMSRRVKDSAFAVRHDHRRWKTIKMLERRTASYGVNPKIHGPQMHKHTQLGKCKLILETIQWPLVYKTKSFCFGKKLSFVAHQWRTLDGLVCFLHSAFACVRKSVRTWDKVSHILIHDM